MSVEVEKSITESAKAFMTIVWPNIKVSLGGGHIVPVETVTDSRFAKQLDMNAGIDGWQLLQINDTTCMRGIASRVQWDKGHRRYPFSTFTLRCDIGGGTTEYHKRMAAINAVDRGALYPHLTVQAYLGPKTDPVLLECGWVRTQDLMAYCKEHKVEQGHKMKNGQDGNGFLVVPWNALHSDGYRCGVWRNGG